MSRAGRRLALAAGVLVGLHGCGAARSEATSVALPVPGAGEATAEAPATKLEDLPTAPPPGAAATEAVVVWVGDEQLPLHVRSLWIETSSARLRAPAWIAASRDEPVAVVRGSLLALRNAPVAQPLIECSDCPDCGEGLPASTTLFGAAAVDLATGATKAVTSPEPMTDVHDAGVGFDVGGLFGDVVFLTEHTVSSACNTMHPWFSDRAFAFDLAAGRETEVVPSAAQKADTAAAAKPQLAEKRASCGEEEAFEPELYGTLLRFDTAAKPRAVYTFTAPVSYMCGTGPGHYSVEAEVVRDELPARRPDFQVPPWVAHLLRESKVLGISRTVPPDQLDALRRAFRGERP